MNIKLSKTEIKDLIKVVLVSNLFKFKWRCILTLGLHFFKMSDTNSDGKLNIQEFESLIKQLYFRKEMISLFKL
jgi:hypothetical protein